MRIRLIRSLNSLKRLRGVGEVTAHVSNNSGNNEWYTPQCYLDSARLVMGQIDIDPASNDIAQQKVQATTYYTAETNGLDKAWLGNLWMNPPYSAALIKQFASKLVQEVLSGNTQQFVVLVNNATETGWFKELLSVSDAVCLVNKRIKFLDVTGNPVNSPLQGQAILYGGNNPLGFANEFTKHGVVLKVMTHKRK